MTSTNTSGHERLETQRRYRRLLFACPLTGLAGFVAASELGYPLVGVGLYWAGALGTAVVWKGTSVQLFDEREASLERRASHVTLNAFAFALILGVPGLVALEEVGLYGISPAVSGAIWGYVALYATFGVVYTAYRLRS